MVFDEGPYDTGSVDGSSERTEEVQRLVARERSLGTGLAE